MFVTNLWAIPVAAIAAMALGFLWYSPVLFGKTWAKAKGLKLDMKPNPMLFIWQFIAEVAVASVLALLILASGATRVSGGTLIGFYVGLIVACVLFTGTLFGGGKRTVFIIDASHFLAVLVVMGAILGAFAW